MSPKQVAIIGAGAGGSSAAYFLHQFSSSISQPVNITLFERNSYIGGRSTTVNAYDDPSQPVELGASIFVEVNRILVEAAKAFNLSTRSFSPDRAETGGPELGVWNGQEFVVTMGGGKWWDLGKILWRYGYAPIKTKNLMKEMVGKFTKMYDAPYFPWGSLSDVVEKLGLNRMTGMTGEQYLQQNGVGELFAREIIQASTRVNYAQNLPLIHGVETMVCMATDGAMAIEGGNWQLFEGMVKRGVRDVRLETEVTEVKKLGNGSYEVAWKKADGDVEVAASSKRFDAVILAAPYQFSNIKMDESISKIPDEIPYVKLHVTLFSSPHLLSPAAFNLSPGAAVPQVILTTLQPNERPGADPHYAAKAGFFSISLLRTATNPDSIAPGRPEYIYKIFSPAPVTSSFLSHILGVAASANSNDELDKHDVSWIYRKVWNSYPYEYPRVTFEELKLDDGLWYTSAIESFVSTMETSTLIGMNVARLMVDEWEETSESSMGKATAFPFDGKQVPLKSKL
ncbi:MAG: hypothetical protein M1820_009747 [Bogoriella megaspora]|nr:MAG: hypothetical protein M1820_009747 [Bogoriella megaspora]